MFVPCRLLNFIYWNKQNKQTDGNHRENGRSKRQRKRGDTDNQITQKQLKCKTGGNKVVKRLLHTFSIFLSIDTRWPVPCFLCEPKLRRQTTRNQPQYLRISYGRAAIEQVCSGEISVNMRRASDKRETHVHKEMGEGVLVFGAQQDQNIEM